MVTRRLSKLNNTSYLKPNIKPGENVPLPPSARDSFLETARSPSYAGNTNRFAGTPETTPVPPASKSWTEGKMIGKMNVGDFTSLAGSLGYAIAPDTPMGRVGAVAAGFAQREQNRLAEAPDAALKREKMRAEIDALGRPKAGTAFIENYNAAVKAGFEGTPEDWKRVGGKGEAGKRESDFNMVDGKLMKGNWIDGTFKPQRGASPAESKKWNTGLGEKGTPQGKLEQGFNIVDGKLMKGNWTEEGVFKAFREASPAESKKWNTSAPEEKMSATQFKAYEKIQEMIAGGASLDDINNLAREADLGQFELTETGDMVPVPGSGWFGTDFFQEEVPGMKITPVKGGKKVTQTQAIKLQTITEESTGKEYKWDFKTNKMYDEAGNEVKIETPEEAEKTKKPSTPVEPKKTTKQLLEGKEQTGKEQAVSGEPGYKSVLRGLKSVIGSIPETGAAQRRKERDIKSFGGRNPTKRSY